MHPGEQVIVVAEHGHRTTVTPVPATAQQIFVRRRLLTADQQKYFALVSITFAAERTPSVMRPTIGLSSFQHCQHSGTSRCVSHTRTNKPCSSTGPGRLLGNTPHPSPPRTAALNPSAVGTKCCGCLKSRRNTFRTNMSCRASSRFRASDGASDTERQGHRISRCSRGIGSDRRGGHPTTTYTGSSARPKR
jgi:hypothetical protein